MIPRPNDESPRRRRGLSGSLHRRKRRSQALKFERVILWAGLFPPDLDFVKGNTVLSRVKTYMVIGNDDPFLTPDRIKEFDQLAAQLGIQPEKITFEGKHEINEEVLRGFI